MDPLMIVALCVGVAFSGFMIYAYFQKTKVWPTCYGNILSLRFGGFIGVLCLYLLFVTLFAEN